MEGETETNVVMPLLQGAAGQHLHARVPAHRVVHVLDEHKEIAPSGTMPEATDERAAGGV